MAAFKFKRKPNKGLTFQFGVEFDRQGTDLPRKDQFAAMERHSHAPVIPQVDVDAAEPIIQELISNRELYGDAAENLGQLIDQLPVSVQEYIGANNVQPTSEEFLMILWGQQAFYRVNNTAEVPAPVPSVPTAPKMDTLSGGTS